MEAAAWWPRPSRWGWAVSNGRRCFRANLGLVSVENSYKTGYLEGNQVNYDTFEVEAGGGVAIFFTDYLSLSPTISGIYGRVENKFDPMNPNGIFVKSVGSGTLVDWTMDTWSVVPSLKLEYQRTWGRTIFDFSSCYDFYHTASFESSSPIMGVNGNSSTWVNKLDVDVPLGVKVFDREIHTGGYFSRTDVFGDAANGMRTDYVYTANGRLVLHFLGKLWKVRWLGLGASYFWGQEFSGWLAGLDIRLKF